eukprot:gnl/TRDRNA2_/TRDRNA2_186980_c0_seq1.p1 gnl/TRDRNA2_/TRDRNA2_186980_c0~~gnl/TRDRNA2_/TRDRNA2_186980_c0_seq1.p1  ORF type:complete len:514 (+),score=103.75 gnl/TRDRNA2_/TRDRNA2_186980_c0_seq1:75-1616(+)
MVAAAAPTAQMQGPARRRNAREAHPVRSKAVKKAGSQRQGAAPPEAHACRASLESVRSSNLQTDGNSLIADLALVLSGSIEQPVEFNFQWECMSEPEDEVISDMADEDEDDVASAEDGLECPAAMRTPVNTKAVDIAKEEIATTTPPIAPGREWCSAKRRRFLDAVEAAARLLVEDAWEEPAEKLEQIKEHSPSQSRSPLRSSRASHQAPGCSSQDAEGAIAISTNAAAEPAEDPTTPRDDAADVDVQVLATVQTADTADADAESQLQDSSACMDVDTKHEDAADVDVETVEVPPICHKEDGADVHVEAETAATDHGADDAKGQLTVQEEMCAASPQKHQTESVEMGSVYENNVWNPISVGAPSRALLPACSMPSLRVQRVVHQPHKARCRQLRPFAADDSPCSPLRPRHSCWTLERLEPVPRDQGAAPLRRFTSSRHSQATPRSSRSRYGSTTCSSAESSHRSSSCGASPPVGCSPAFGGLKLPPLRSSSKRPPTGLPQPFAGTLSSSWRLL